MQTKPPPIVVSKIENDSGDGSPESPRGSINFSDDEKPKKPEPPKSEFETKIKPIIDKTGLK